MQQHAVVMGGAGIAVACLMVSEQFAVSYPLHLSVSNLRSREAPRSSPTNALIGSTLRCNALSDATVSPFPRAQAFTRDSGKAEGKHRKKAKRRVTGERIS